MLGLGLALTVHLGRLALGIVQNATDSVRVQSLQTSFFCTPFLAVNHLAGNEPMTNQSSCVTSNQLSLHRQAMFSCTLSHKGISYTVHCIGLQLTSFLSNLVYANVMYNIMPPNPNRSNTKPNPNYSPLVNVFIFHLTAAAGSNALLCIIICLRHTFNYLIKD